MKSYILAHDLGTTNHKCTVFQDNGKIIASSTRLTVTKYGEDGVAEQDPKGWWRNVVETTKEVLQTVAPTNIAVVSFSAHMNGCLPVNKDGDVLYNSIIHADSRSNSIKPDVFQIIDENQLYKLTGNRIDAHYPVLKIYWLKKYLPEVYKNTAYFLQAKDYLAYRMTGTLGVTDYSDASLTGMMNLTKREWEYALFSDLKLSQNKMPDILPSSSIIGHIKKEIHEETGLLQGTPVVIGGGDGACATIGAGCFNIGDSYINIGTTAWVSKVTNEPFIDSNKRVFTICDLNEQHFNVLGTMKTAGAAYEWAIKQFTTLSEWGKLESKLEYGSFEKILNKVPPGANGVIFHPYLLGERSPIWNDMIRSSFFGISLNHNRFDLLKAVLEGVSYSLAGIAEILSFSDPVTKFNLIGGMSKNKVFNQVLSDVLQRPVYVSEKSSEATSLGAAIAGGVGVGLYRNYEEGKRIIRFKEQYDPLEKHSEIYQQRIKIFKELYLRLKDLDLRILGE
ncbi:xylulokinase [Metabacillus litoralis]|uniref:xylulokinase n=1 Tax=Metabacillus litoralis TaxID=152268 RepID=UPI0020421930|nr:FGGY-family carbohydrate kinase [Metabacillus litoralis]MCM3410862.1 FGGY-family carbohydrate kinase [Metabacillus litoralis]